MHKRILILSAIVLAALIALTCLGYHAVAKWAQGLEGARLGEFAEVAEQIRQDVKRKLDEFVQQEQQRPYTDYLYSYVPDSVIGDAQAMPVLRSPLAGQMTNSVAYGYFQVEPDNEIVNPYFRKEQIDRAGADEMARDVQKHLDNVAQNVLPVIEARREVLARASSLSPETQEGSATPAPDVRAAGEELSELNQKVKGAQSRSKAYAIESLQQKQQSQIVTQDRAVVASNWSAPPTAQRAAPPRPADPGQRAPVDLDQITESQPQQAEPVQGYRRRLQETAGPQSAPAEQQSQVAVAPIAIEDVTEADASDVVQIRIDPFVPLVVPDRPGERSLFGGQVFLLRSVQIEDRRLLQGFQVDETELVQQVEESAQRLMREGMAFDLPATHQTDKLGAQTDEATAYTAILDFGFGDLILNLKELDPGWLTKRIGGLQHVYLGIVAVVGVAVILALASLWRTTQAQIALAKKKDEFISAVSHELRTPLTSIRMYAEMLENNWLSSQGKATEYYKNIRQESERLTRLIDNVLDFSRLQRGRKHYDFRLGDVNACIADVVAMMRPYAAEHGFSIETQPGSLRAIAFDRDAVAQIVVNLLDNAVKYARSAEDKTIVVRTQEADGYAIIEVEDHGPGVAHRQRKKVFEQFYRGAAEETAPDAQPTGAQVTGTGLGLALVRRFAEAHDGFVEILTANPRGAIFRVGLTIHG